MKQNRLKSEVQDFKRQRILEEARELFYANGYEATTLDAIAEGLNVTKPFLYSYFGNKSEILRAICEVGIRRSLAALETSMNSTLAARDKLKLIVEQVTTIVITNQKYIVVYEREEKNLDPKNAKYLMDLRRDFGAQLARLLESGTAAGEFDVRDPLLTAVEIGGLITWAASWYRPAGRWSQTEIIAHTMLSVDRLVGGGRPRPVKRAAARS